MWKQEKISPSKTFCCLESGRCSHRHIHICSVDHIWLLFNKCQFLMKCLHTVRPELQVCRGSPTSTWRVRLLFVQLPHQSIKHNQFFERLSVWLHRDRFFLISNINLRKNKNKTCLHEAVFKTITVHTDTLETIANNVTPKPGLVCLLPVGRRRR